MEYCSATAFFEAWQRGVQLAGHRWFGDGATEVARSKHDLAPRYDDIVGRYQLVWVAR